MAIFGRREVWINAAFWTLAFCLGAFSARAGGRYCVVGGWGTGEGLLPQSSVISMAQTSDGYLWLGTRNGLARFDGVHFSVFDESTTPKVNSIQTVKLFEDSRSNLWIGTESAGVMLVTNGQIFPLDIGKGRRQGRVVSICEDEFGAVWLLTADREVARYRDGNVNVWTIAIDALGEGRSIIAEKSGFVWVATEGTLMALDPKAIGGQQPALPVKARAYPGHLDYLLPSRTGGYWRLANGLVEKWQGMSLKGQLGSYPRPAGQQQPVRAACEDREGNLIVGTYGQGVFWFDSQGHATRICTTNGLANDSVLSMVLDSDDNLWVGMDGGGRSDHPLNRVTHSIFNLVDSTVGKTIQSISEDSQGGIWYSPKNDDFHYLKDGIDRTYESSPPVKAANPWAVLVDSHQNVWAAIRWTLGINLFHLEGDVFRPVTGANALSPEIMALHQGHDGRLWVGTQGGLGCWDDEQWKTFTTNDGLSGSIVRAIADDTNGDVWIGTEHGGLDLLRGGKFTSFQKNNGLPGDTNSFPSDNISCLYSDELGVLWIGTIGNGLIRLVDGQWKHYTTRNGLTGNSIDYLLGDDEGYLWIGANSGLMRVSKKDLDDFDPARGFLFCRGYDKRDGLPANECTYGSQPAACRARDGTLWFPTIAGMVSVNPGDIKRNTNPPLVVIEAVFVDQQPQNTNGLRTPPPETITVPAGKENLDIQYTSLNLASAGRAFFQYQLEGHQTNWTQAGEDRLARYVNLPHGQYRFHVQARNEDGTWNRIGASLDVVVLPAFWETGWFKAGMAAALLLIVIGVVYFVSTQKLQRQLADMRQQQALEKERARIARDIHDQVGASLTQLSLLGEMVEEDKNNPAEAETHARQISQTARETARELDEIVWTVNPSNDTLDGLVNYICKHTQEYLGVAGLRYRLDVPAQLPAAAISPEARHNVFLAAKEAVTNVVRHAQASEAWLRLQLAEKNFTLEIEDNGRGPAGLKAKAAESRNGLRNMRKRMEDIGGEFFIGPGSKGGTLVRLTVPLRSR